MATGRSEINATPARPNNKASLKAAIDNLTAGGNGTAFNEAADKAVSLLAALSCTAQPASAHGRFLLGSTARAIILAILQSYHFTRAARPLSYFAHSLRSRLR